MSWFWLTAGGGGFVGPRLSAQRNRKLVRWGGQKILFFFFFNVAKLGLHILIASFFSEYLYRWGNKLLLNRGEREIDGIWYHSSFLVLLFILLSYRGGGGLDIIPSRSSWWECWAIHPKGIGDSRLLNPGTGSKNGNFPKENETWSYSS